ncbi:stage III sporulation protein AE [Paenibacillus pasadenensis]|uniref:stage III sporulation protein AE n=1 Tax=Paenibacillus pasadenensis TaxID=217090 RepID=UPI00203D5F4E|nr:stage III sporulation protein AE [Paenibacillus pasadenensis]MCM3747294.1 stage III sporulation protein AE [Paenibacillus pasadenensis]
MRWSWTRLLPLMVLLAAVFLAAAPGIAAAEAPSDAATAAPGDSNGQAAGMTEELAREQARAYGTDAVESYWNDLMKQYGGYFPQGAMPSFIEMITPGGEGMKPAVIMKGLLNMVAHEVLYNAKLLVSIVLLAVFSSILQTLQSAFERQAVSTVAYAVAYMVLIVLAVNSFHVAIGYAREAIETMIQFMMAMVPLLMTLIASTGSLVTVSLLHPVIVFMVHLVGTLIYTVVFPLLFFSAVLHIASAISDRFKVTQLANMLRTIGAGLLGVMLTVFLGVVSIQGATGSMTDGVTLRTAKFISGSFVPVVGKTFSDAADTVISASMLAKNAVGLAGVIILLFLSALPAIKILVLAAIYNVCGAVLQPLGSSPITVCLSTIGKTMLYVFGALAAVSLMFFLAVTIILTAGNAAIMMR